MERENVLQGVAGDQIYRALIEGFQNLNVDYKILKFERIKNPYEFQDALNKYFTENPISDSQKIDVVLNSLERAVRVWFQTSREEFNNFNEFKEAYFSKFYSVLIKVKIQANCREKCYYSSEGNLQNYFMEQVREAQFFHPKLGNYQMHYCLVQQIPICAREALVPVHYNDVKINTQALSQLDDIHG